jgi:hypothetical protein
METVGQEWRKISDMLAYWSEKTRDLLTGMIAMPDDVQPSGEKQ